MLSATPELLIEDIDQTIDWYSSNLNFGLIFASPQQGPHTFARIKRENVEIMLFRRAEFAQEIPSFSPLPMGGSFVLYLEVTDIEREWSQAKDKATIVQALHTTDYGSTEFTIQDLNGYHLMFGARG